MIVRLSMLRAGLGTALLAALALSACSKGSAGGSSNGNSGAGAAGTGAASAASAAKGKKNPAGIVGPYNVLVGGFYTGRGDATIAGSAVVITASVKDDEGNAGQLDASIVVTDGHFLGAGTVMGQAITLEGRVDAADVGSKKHKPLLRIARLVCTFRTLDGHYGRIVGEHQNAPPTPLGP